MRYFHSLSLGCTVGLSGLLLSSRKFLLLRLLEHSSLVVSCPQQYQPPRARHSGQTRPVCAALPASPHLQTSVSGLTPGPTLSTSRIHTLRAGPRLGRWSWWHSAVASRQVSAAAAPPTRLLSSLPSSAPGRCVSPWGAESCLRVSVLGPRAVRECLVLGKGAQESSRTRDTPCLGGEEMQALLAQP